MTESPDKIPARIVVQTGWWALLLVLSSIAVGLFEVAGLPGGLLIGPMVAAVIVAVAGARLFIPTMAYRAAQAIIAA